MSKSPPPMPTGSSPSAPSPIALAAAQTAQPSPTASSSSTSVSGSPQKEDRHLLVQQTARLSLVPPPPPTEDDDAPPPPPPAAAAAAAAAASSSGAGGANWNGSVSSSPTPITPIPIRSGESSPANGGTPPDGSPVPSPTATPTPIVTVHGAPNTRKPAPQVGKPTVNQGYGTYQSLQSTFGDVPSDGPASPKTATGSSVGLVSTRAPGKSSSATNVKHSSASSSELDADGLPIQRSRSASIDRLTGRVALQPSLSSPLKVGWLRKEGEGVLGGFKKRWCVLGKQTLDFFKEITDEKSQGTIVLPGAAIFVEDKTDFHILPVRAMKKISFRCDNEFDRNAWVKILNDVSAVADDLSIKVFDASSYEEWSTNDIDVVLLPALTRILGKVGTMSSIWGVGDAGNVGVLLSGCLTKMGEKIRNFKRRYFVLIGSLLLYFENEESYMLTDAGGATVIPKSSSLASKTSNASLTGASDEPSVSSSSSSSSSASASSSSSAINPKKSLPAEAVNAATAAIAANALASSKGSHGKEVLASLARTHLRTQRKSITPGDLLNHHMIRRGSQHPGMLGAPVLTPAEEEKRKQQLQKKALKGEGKPALGMIPLKDCILTLEPSHSKQWGFSIQTKERKYYLFADNEEELRAWFYMLNLIVHSLPIQRYMKSMLETEMEDALRGIVHHENELNILPPEDIALLKKQLVVTLLDPTCVKYLQHFWIERQTFHEPRTYPILYPLETPITMLREDGKKYFDGMLEDEAGEYGENAIHLPLHYLYFWLDVESWRNLRVPTTVREDPNPYATAQDPSCVESCIPLARSYRQQRCEEIIDKYLSHGAPYPVFLDHAILDEILSSCLRGVNAPNKITPAATLFQKAQDLVTEMLTIEVFTRYLRNKNSCWCYLTSIAAKYDENLILQRAEAQVETLLARLYDPDVYEELTTEEKYAEEDERARRFQTLIALQPEEVESLFIDCAEAFSQLPNTDPTKLIYHNYLYALQRLREYHALFGAQPANPVSLSYRQTTAAKAFFQDFLVPGARHAICVPYKLVRNLRSFLSVASHRRQLLFMDVEHCVVTELVFGCKEAKAKLKKRVESAKESKAAKSSSSGGHGTPSGGGRAEHVGHHSISHMDDLNPAPQPTMGTTTSLVLSDSDVPFNIVFGVSSLFSHFRRFAQSCRHNNPQYLWDQIALVTKIFDYRNLSDAKVLTAYARQVYSQYLSENAPHKINLSKSVTDQFKVNISQAIPGPHVFLPILKEMYKSLEHLYTSMFKHSSNSIPYSYLQEDFGLFVRDEICVTQGKRDWNFDATISTALLNKNASTWMDYMDHTGPASVLDESMVNLSSHQALWCAYFQQFLQERFCAENALFYIEADDYRRCPGPSYRILRAQRLYDRYISETAQLQVNVPSWVARELTAILRESPLMGGVAPSGPVASPNIARQTSRPSSAAVPSPTAAGGASSSSSGPSAPNVDLTASSPLLYLAAQREIFLLIHNDSGIKPFMESQPWKAYRALCQAKV